MPTEMYRVFTQREREDGKETKVWAVAEMTVDETEGAIKLNSKGALAKKWDMTLRPDQLTSFAIEMISDTNTLAAMYGGGLIGYGVAALMGRWVKLPVLNFEQASAEAGNRGRLMRSGISVNGSGRSTGSSSASSSGVSADSSAASGAPSPKSSASGMRSPKILPPSANATSPDSSFTSGLRPPAISSTLLRRARANTSPSSR